MSKKTEIKKPSINNKLMAIVAVTTVVITGFFIFKSQTQEKEVHYHAGFKVFVDGQQQDFSDFKYMSIKPCTTDEHDENEKKEDKIHLHDGNGKVVHVHADGLKWENLFKSINYSFDSSKKITGFVNGKKVKNILSRSIKPYDSVIILVGDVTDESDFVKLGVTKSEIIKAENVSESCGKSSS
jgi:hypothetical protein